eukprot:219317_1
MFRKWLSVTTVTCASVITFNRFVVTADTDNKHQNKLYYSTVIIGAGWAGVGVAASLKFNNVNDFVILEKGNCVGYFWSKLYNSIKMNTYQHRLWHSPLSIEPKEIEDYRSKSEVKHIKFDEQHNEWILNLNNGQQIHTSLLTIATSINCIPYIPNFNDMNKFEGYMIHSFEYFKPQQFDNMKYKNGKRKFLVIGCGNSAIEIAGEIKKYDEKTNIITLLIRNGRHFTKENTKHRFERILDKICKPSPFSDESLLNDNLISSNDLSFHKDIIDFDKFTDFMIFTNMQKYGISKPKLSPTADHYYNKKLTIVDRGTIPFIKKHKIAINNKTIKQFTKNGVQFDDGTYENYDVIIFGTGFRHGLNQLFDENIWNKLNTIEYNYPHGLIQMCKEKNIEIPMHRAYAWPNLNGRCRSKIYNNLYFAGFDQGYLGGLTIGLYSWCIGEEIAVKLGKISIDKCTIPWIETETMLAESKV